MTADELVAKLRRTNGAEEILVYDRVIEDWVPLDEILYPGDGTVRLGGLGWDE